MWVSRGKGGGRIRYCGVFGWNISDMGFPIETLHCLPSSLSGSYIYIPSCSPIPLPPSCAIKQKLIEYPLQDDIAKARPDIDRRTEEMVSKGRWMVPGYKVRSPPIVCICLTPQC